LKGKAGVTPQTYLDTNIINMTEYKRQDITTVLRGALQEVKDHIEGKKRLQSLDSLLEEL
jgi:hypothetical protein